MIVVFLLVAACSFTPGCDERKEVSETKEKEAGLLFANGSKGLPSEGEWRHGIGFSDLNGDGHMDILAPPARNEAKDRAPHVWYGDGGGEWTPADLQFPKNVKYDYGTVAADDFDGDGVLDMVLAMHGIGLKVLRGMRDGRFEDFSKGLPPGRTFISRAVIAGQFDDAPHLDVAAVSEGPFAKEYPYPSGVWVCVLRDGEWSCKPLGGKEVHGLGADQLGSGDVNGDGRTDIVVASLNALKPFVVWINDGKGNFSQFNEGLPKGVIFEFVTLADVDHDGRDDLVASVSGIGKEGGVSLKAFLSRADGWEEFSTGLPSEIFWCVDACDLDQDGAMEIVAGTALGGIRVFSRKSDGWEERTVSGLPKEGLNRMYGISCVDLTGDGYRDIVVNYGEPEGKGGGIQVFLNQQKGVGKKAPN